MMSGDPRSDLIGEAARRFARLRAGDMTAAELAALDAWMEARPEHKAVWADLHDSWMEIEPLASEFSPAAELARRRRWSPPAIAAIAAALAVTLGLGLTLARHVPAIGPAPEVQQASIAPAIFETTRGQRSDVLLSDGTMMTLDASSRARFIKARSQRTLYLERGRAVFAVAKDASRPFVVRAGRTSVTATGTRFVVDLVGGQTNVGLVEGHVRVERPAGSTADPVRLQTIDMQPADWLTIPESGPWSISKRDQENMLSWVSGVLVFQGSRLDEIASEMNRYSARPIVIADAATAGKRMSAVVSAGDVETIKAGVVQLGLAKARERRDGALELYGASGS